MQHRLVDVGVDDLPGRAGGLAKARARSPVPPATSSTSCRAARRYGHGKGLPGAMHPQRHQVVHHVVLRRHRIEDAAHALGLGRIVDRRQSRSASRSWTPAPAQW